jgi:hypothetical protein
MAAETAILYMAENSSATAAAAASPAPTGSPSPAPERAADASDSAVAAFFGEEAPAQPAEADPAQGTDAVTTTATVDPTTPTAESAEGETTQSAEEGAPPKEEPEEGDVPAETGDDAARGFALPEWAAGLPEEAQSQLREMGAGFVGTIRKFKEQRNDAREEAQDAKAEMETLKAKANKVLAGPVPLQPTPADPLARITNEEQLEAHLAEAESVIEWAERELNAFDDDPDHEARSGEKAYTRADVRDIRKNAELAQRHGPKRLEFLRKQVSADEIARKHYPEQFREGSAFQRAAAEIIDDNREIVRRWDAKLAIGDELIGRSVRNGHFKLIKVESTAAKDAAKSGAAASKPAATKPAALSAVASTPAGKPSNAKPSLKELKDRAAKGDPVAENSLIDSFFN